MATLVKPVVPLAWEAFEDYLVHGVNFSRMEMGIIRRTLAQAGDLLVQAVTMGPEGAAERLHGNFPGYSSYPGR